jgi:hypothetical protein
MIREAGTVETFEGMEAFGDKYGCLWQHARGSMPEVYVLTKMSGFGPVYVHSVSFQFTMEEQQVAKCDVEKYSKTYLKEAIRAYLGR